MKKNSKKIDKQGPSAKPARRVVVLRELENDELSGVNGGRSWWWEPDYVPPVAVTPIGPGPVGPVGPVGP